MVTITNLSFSYDARPVFRDLSLVFGERWTALTGANETGKSTFIKLISGVLTPDSGAVSASGGIVVCPQDSEAVLACFTESEVLNSSEFFALLTQLEIGDDWIERWGTLSGGEKSAAASSMLSSESPPTTLTRERRDCSSPRFPR